MADTDEEAADRWYDRKSVLMAEMLGKEHDMVMHAMIPYSIGGGLDLYYYPNGITGTGIATKELSEFPGQGSSNDVFQCYELVMFTRHAIDLDVASDKATPFGLAHSNIDSILNRIAPYSAEATLNPCETCEFPADMPTVGGRCLIFDAYPSYPANSPAEFGLLAIVEIHRAEMEFARGRRHGGSMLIERLKSKGHFPFSDLDREPVV